MNKSSLAVVLISVAMFTTAAEAALSVPLASSTTNIAAGTAVGGSILVD